MYSECYTLELVLYSELNTHLDSGQRVAWAGRQRKERHGLPANRPQTAKERAAGSVGIPPAAQDKTRGQASLA